MGIAESTTLIEKFEIYIELYKERQRFSSDQKKHKIRLNRLIRTGKLLPNWGTWDRKDIDYHQVQILGSTSFTNSSYAIDIETICEFALLVNINEAYTEIETKIGELLNETIEEERGKIVHFDSSDRSNRHHRVFFQAFSMEYCGNDSGKEKYYVLLNKENFGNKNFNLIYKNKSKIFQFLEFNRITVGEEYNVSDDYIEKKFSQWEKDKKMRLGARDAALHRYETVEEWDANNEELPIQDQVKEEDSKNMGNYNCLVIGTITKGWKYKGWIEQFPLEDITITWSERDDIDKYYLLDENEIIRVGQLLDEELMKRSEEEAQNLGIYRQYSYEAKSWSNDNFIKQEEKIFPIYHDGYGFHRFKQGDNIGIVASVSAQLQNMKRAALVKLCNAEGLPTDGKKDELIARLVEAKERKEEDDNWYWEIERVRLDHWFAHLGKEKGEWVRAKTEQIKKVRRGEIEGTFRESHGYFLDKAKVKDFDIIYKKDVFSLEELYTTKMIKRLIRTVYRILTENVRKWHQKGGRKGPWIIICDEKYLNEKVHGKNAIVIMYSIIPPGAANDCPPTSAFYHGMHASFYERETKSLQNSISKNENIENYSFLIDADDLSDSSKLVARAISITFPIIVQIINNKLKSKSRETPLKVSFINERIDTEEYGIGTNIVLETSDRLELVMEKFEKVAPFESLPKSPNSHPFLQYPDLIGRKYDSSGYNVSIDKYNTSIKEFEAPMGTFEEIRDIILTDSITPIDFFKKLIDSKNIELAKFCGSMPYSMRHYSEILKEIIHDNLNILYDNKDLKTLFKEIRERSEKENSREIIRQILTELFVLLKEDLDDNLLPKYELSSRDEFEWLMQRLSFETHLDNFEMIEKVKDELNRRKNEGELRKAGIYGNRLITMENLFISSDQNSFVFDNFEKSKILEIINEENSMVESDNQVGAMCLSLLLKNKNSNSEEFGLAEMGENYLLKREGETSRRVTNMIEINIIRNLIENDSGGELIGFRTLQEIKNNNDKYSSYYSNSPYFMAAVLKTIALTNFSQLEDNQDLRKFAKMILDGRCFIGEHIYYPNNRVAYWFIRAYFNLNGTSIDKIDSRVNKCSRQLFNYKNSDSNYNTVGLMTMCQLLDLYYRFGFNEEMSLFEFEQTDEDLLWEDYKEKLNSVKTAFSTKKWFEENAPDKDDRLRPLNFTYR